MIQPKRKGTLLLDSCLFRAFVVGFPRALCDTETSSCIVASWDLGSAAPDVAHHESDCFTDLASHFGGSGASPYHRNLMRQYLRQKLSRTIGGRIFEERLFRLVLHYFTAIHEDHPIGDSPSEAHLVSDH